MQYINDDFIDDLNYVTVNIPIYKNITKIITVPIYDTLLPYNVIENYIEDVNNTCPITQEVIKECIMTCCNHNFEKNDFLIYINSTQNKTCPLCRHNLTNTKIQVGEKYEEIVEKVIDGYHAVKEKIKFNVSRDYNVLHLCTFKTPIFYSVIILICFFNNK
jgi:hypothetical protein